MKPSFGDLVRQSLTDPGWPHDPRILIQVQFGLFALVAGWSLLNAVMVLRRRRSGRSLRRPRLLVWARTTIVLVLCSMILAMEEFVWWQMAGTRALGPDSGRVSSWDVADESFRSHFALAIGLTTAAFGLASGWLLEWFADGMAPDGSSSA